MTEANYKSYFSSRKIRFIISQYSTTLHLRILEIVAKYEWGRRDKKKMLYEGNGEEVK